MMSYDNKKSRNDVICSKIRIHCSPFIMLFLGPKEWTMLYIGKFLEGILEKLP